MSEMTDRVTQAIGTYFFRMWASTTSYAVMKGEAWDGPPVKAGLTMSEARDLAFRLNAEAAIEVMRVPTEAMKKAGAEWASSHDEPVYPHQAGEVWEAMIDAARGKESQ